MNREKKVNLKCIPTTKLRSSNIYQIKFSVGNLSALAQLVPFIKFIIDGMKLLQWKKNPKITISK